MIYSIQLTWQQPLFGTELSKAVIATGNSWNKSQTELYILS